MMCLLPPCHGATFCLFATLCESVVIVYQNMHFFAHSHVSKINSQSHELAAYTAITLLLRQSTASSSNTSTSTNASIPAGASARVFLASIPAGFPWPVGRTGT
jgi:hypothetical protein